MIGFYFVVIKIAFVIYITAKELNNLNILPPCLKALFLYSQSC
jgi:hypothetical protein